MNHSSKQPEQSLPANAEEFFKAEDLQDFLTSQYFGYYTNLKQASKFQEIKLKPSVAASSPLKKHNPDVVMIGSGPVGLWTAVQIKLLLPNFNILLLDKHENYQRSHLLRVSDSSLKNIPNDDCMRTFKNLAKELTGKIRTNEFEKRLWEKAETLGISKEIMEITDVSELKTMFPNLKAIIGTDGSHSLVRKQIFDDKLSVKKTIEHVILVKYDAEGKAEGLDPMKTYAGLKLINHLTAESVGKDINGQSPVTLQLRVNEDTYKKMKDSTFKNPYNLTSDKEKFDPSLYESITTWLNMRSNLTEEKRVENSTKVSAINLDVYRAETAAKYIPSQDLAVFLCGDSAFGVPFFRALNNGMLCGSFLAETFKKSSSKLEKATKDYNKYFDKLANKEIKRAQRIAWSHKVVETAVKFNAKMPWQFISLKGKKKDFSNPISEAGF